MLRQVAVVAVTAAVGVATAIFVARRMNYAEVAPPAPQGQSAKPTIPATTSRLAITVAAPTAAIARQLEEAIPRSFSFDVRGDARAFGSPSRGAISVTADVDAQRLSASTPVGGRVQVEKKIVVFNASVGVDVSGAINASISPLVHPNWSIEPRLDIGVHLNSAVAKTAVGDINVTGPVRNALGGLAGGLRGDAENKLREVLDVRRHVERLWNEMNRVDKLSENSPTWLRLTPRKAYLAKPRYTTEGIETGLQVDLEAKVFLQDAKPDVEASPLPDLLVVESPSDAFDIGLPVEVDLAVISRLAKGELTKNPILLEPDITVRISDVALKSHGAGLLLTVDFQGETGYFKKAAGRLYITGVPVLDATKEELRVEQPAYTAETKNVLLKLAAWLKHEELLAALSKIAVVPLGEELERIRTKANQELEKLKSQLPKEVAGNVSIGEITVDGLATGDEKAFVLVRGKGKMSARLQP